MEKYRFPFRPCDEAVPFNRSILLSGKRGKGKERMENMLTVAMVGLFLIISFYEKFLEFTLELFSTHTWKWVPQKTQI